MNPRRWAVGPDQITAGHWYFSIRCLLPVVVPSANASLWCRMNALLVKLVAHLNALVVAFPVGWCCLEMEARAEESATASCPACAQHDSGTPSDVPQNDACSCDLQQAVPARAEQLVAAAVSFALLPAIVAFPHSGGSDHNGHYSAVPARGGPPIHILKCVWRC